MQYGPSRKLADTVVQNLRSVWRSWRHNPGFTLASIGVLVLALGASTTVFSALDPILFRSLPYPDEDRLVSMGLLFPGPDGAVQPEVMIDRGYVRLLSMLPQPFESLTTLTGGGPCDITEVQPERLRCLRVEWSFLRTLKINVAAGRDFVAEDDLRGAPVVALITDAVWARRYGRSPEVIGRKVEIDGTPAVIVGVLPYGLVLPLQDADILLLQQFRPLDPEAPFVRFLTCIGRLKKGSTPQQAEISLQPHLSATLDLLPRFPRAPVNWRVRFLRERIVGDTSRTAWLLLGAVAAVQLIAVTTVVTLMLARVATRRREFAVRAALGAGRARLAHLALTESVLLTASAGGLGLLFAFVLLQFLKLGVGTTISQLNTASLDVRVLVFATGLTVVTGLVIGIWPAVSAIRIGPLNSFRTTLATKPRVRFALVASQIAVTAAMLGCSVLLTRSLWNQISVPLGFESERVVTLAATLNVARYSTPELRSAFFEELLTRAQNLPPVASAALTDAPPPRGLTSSISNIAVENRPWDPNAVGAPVRMRRVTPSYFEAFRILTRKGRVVPESDAEPSAVISESLNRLLFGSESGVGQRIRAQQDAPWRRVIAVVADTQNGALGAPSQPELYLVGSVRGVFIGRTAYLVVRAADNTRDAESFLKSAVAEMDPALPATTETVDAQVAAITARPRFVAWFLTLFTAIALSLASAGIYGVVSFLVTQRSRDIGIRIALGATPGRVSRELASEAGIWIAGGIVSGLFLAWASRRAVESQLFRLSASDGASWSVALGILFVAMLVALLRPMIRAARTDPARALRAD
jgi:putative ABC transport system permease protein